MEDMFAEEEEKQRMNLESILSTEVIWNDHTYIKYNEENELLKNIDHELDIVFQKIVEGEHDQTKPQREHEKNVVNNIFSPTEDLFYGVDLSLFDNNNGESNGNTIEEKTKRRKTN